MINQSHGLGEFGTGLRLGTGYLLYLARSLTKVRPLSLLAHECMHYPETVRGTTLNGRCRVFAFKVV